MGGLIALACKDNDSRACQYNLVAVYLVTPSLLAGIFGTVFYVGFPYYITNLSNNENKSLYFGIGYGVLLGSMIIGNTAGSLIANTVKGISFFPSWESVRFCFRWR